MKVKKIVVKKAEYEHNILRNIIYRAESKLDQ